MRRLLLGVVWFTSSLGFGQANQNFSSIVPGAPIGDGSKRAPSTKFLHDAVYLPALLRNHVSVGRGAGSGSPAPDEHERAIAQIRLRPDDNCEQHRRRYERSRWRIALICAIAISTQRPRQRFKSAKCSVSWLIYCLFDAIRRVQRAATAPSGVVRETSAQDTPHRTSSDYQPLPRDTSTSALVRRLVV
jgi:hypothetical protein